MPRRPRLLLGAYACHPHEGSEPGVGWNRAVEATRFADVEVLVQLGGDEKAVLREARRALGLEDRLRFHFLPHTPLEWAVLKTPGAFYAGYRMWHRRAYRHAAARHAERPFDLVHQATMCGFREPGDLWRLGLPFVWGPVGGTQNWPDAFLDYGDLRTRVFERVRTALNGVQLRSGRVRRAAAAADVLLAANTTGQADLEATLGRPVPQLLETGIREVGAAKRWADRRPGPFRLLMAGLLIPRKGVRVTLDALARLRAAARDGAGPEVELVVVGDGPERALLDGVEGVDWRGWIPRDELLGLYATADALAFTSLRDTSGNVMLEALAAGLPIVYLDHQGAHDVCSPGSGVPVPVTTPEATVRAVADAVAALATDPARYDRLSAGAIARAEALSWRINGDAMNAIYARVLAAAAPPAPSGDGVATSARPVLS